jgi:hypothetical protein
VVAFRLGTPVGRPLFGKRRRLPSNTYKDPKFILLSVMLFLFLFFIFNFNFNFFSPFLGPFRF